MEQQQIFQPFLAMMALTLAVWLFLFARRIPFILSSKMTPEDLARPGELARISPPEVSNPSDNLRNLFELPVLFYALVLYLFVTEQVDGTHLACAWVFVAFRALHSIVHCTFNHVMTRFRLYAVAALALWTMLLRAVLA